MCSCEERHEVSTEGGSSTAVNLNRGRRSPVATKASIGSAEEGEGLGGVGGKVRPCTGGLFIRVEGRQAGSLVSMAFKAIDGFNVGRFGG